MRRTFLNKPMLITVICVVGFFGIFFGAKAFTGYLGFKEMMAAGTPPATVTASKVQRQTWQPHINAVGSLRAAQGVDVSSEVDGIVDALPLISGATVKQGDLLVKLRQNIDVAHLQALQAQYELAESAYKRDKAQFAIKAISQATLDTDIANLKNTQAQVQEQAAIVAQKNIVAPFDGYLGISAVNSGQFIKAGDKIVTLQALDPIYADFLVPQQALAKIKVGETVELLSDTYPKDKFVGKITTLEPEVDETTRNVRGEVLFENPKQRLVPGMFVNLMINTGKPQQHLTLPQTAITYNPYGDIVYIIHEAKNKDAANKLTVQQVFVVLGEKRGDQVAVLEGLSADDLVVTSGGLKLQNGGSVVIDNSVKPSTDPNPQVSEE